MSVTLEISACANKAISNSKKWLNKFPVAYGLLWHNVVGLSATLRQVCNPLPRPPAPRCSHRRPTPLRPVCNHLPVLSRGRKVSWSTHNMGRAPAATFQDQSWELGPSQLLRLIVQFLGRCSGLQFLWRPIRNTLSFQHRKWKQQNKKTHKKTFYLLGVKDVWRHQNIE